VRKEKSKMNEAVTTVASRTLTTLDVLRAGRPLVLDFWNTRCVKCPTALAKMDSLASKLSASVTFVACALSLGSQSTIDDVEELAGVFPNLEHVYMDFDTKERVKKALNFTSLPFALAYDANTNIICKGDPMSVDFAVALKEFLDSFQTQGDAPNSSTSHIHAPGSVGP
jgi:thiol-disulfide isomerase/thioredoxin